MTREQLLSSAAVMYPRRSTPVYISQFGTPIYLHMDWSTGRAYEYVESEGFRFYDEVGTLTRQHYNRLARSNFPDSRAVTKGASRRNWKGPTK